ncbi:unnamed protein product [Ceratitis capitata]|uniref:(Mediterranean fruit fly) hypothetical protein n=1 Tax=Ceratitis capitata TaxID=7213 RepID=A0A811UZK0_CERCA|nr:unnamed protein product [Ceratitis capitata]
MHIKLSFIVINLAINLAWVSYQLQFIILSAASQAQNIFYKINILTFNNNKKKRKKTIFVATSITNSQQIDFEMTITKYNLKSSRYVRKKKDKKNNDPQPSKIEIQVHFRKRIVMAM